MSGRGTTLALIAVPCTVLVLAGCASGSSTTGTSPTKPTGGGSTVTTESDFAPTPISCGAPFQPPATGPVTLAARFPATAAPNPEPLTGSVDATSAAALHAVGPGRAEAFLVHDGRVVTLPVPQDSLGAVWDLTPGTAKTVPADLALTSCAADGAALAPGTYDLFVRVVLTSDDGGLESVGGPWPLQVQ